MLNATVQQENTLSRSEMPRRMLSRNIMRCIGLILLLQPIVFVLTFNVLLGQTTSAQAQDDSEALGQLLRNVLSDHFDQGFTRHEGDLLDSLDAAPSVAFACVVDNAGKLLHASVFEQKAWDLMRKQYPTFLSGNKPVLPVGVKVIIQDDMFLKSFAVTGRNEGATDKKATQIKGYLVLGMHDHRQTQVIASMHVSQVLTGLVVAALSLPVVGLLVRYWTRPLFSLMEGIRRLANGEQPTPVADNGSGEFGFLAKAFNSMAGRLLTSQSALRDANTNLERKVSDRTQKLQEAMVELDRLASTDAMTGLANRRIFAEKLNGHFKLATSRRMDLLCVMIDLDGFKSVNDTLGHDAGDDIIKLAARLIGETAGPQDVAARLGGDEFALLLLDADLATAERIANQLRNRFEEAATQYFEKRDEQLNVSMSVGLASLRTHGAESADLLVIQADKALYNAKNSGKARVRTFDVSLAA